MTGASPADALVPAVDQQGVVDLLQAAIRVPGVAGAEDDITRFLADRLRTGGWSDVESIGTGNVVARVPGAGGRPLLFLVYIDSPPAGEMAGAYDAAILPGDRFSKAGPVVRGRGACTKATLAAMVEVGEAFLRGGIRPAGDLVLIGTSRDAVGLQAVEARGRLPEGRAIVGEPTDNGIGIAARGITWMDLEIRGRPWHAGTPQRAVNPIRKLPQVLGALDGIELPSRDGLPPATLTPTGIAHRGSPPRTPYSVTIRLDRRTLPGETPEAVVTEVERALGPARDVDPTLDISVRAADFMSPFLGDAAGALVRDLGTAIGRVTGREARVMSLPFATNAGYLAMRGHRAVAFGPTRIEDRGDEEHAEIASMVDAARILALLAATG